MRRDVLPDSPGPQTYIGVCALSSSRGAHYGRRRIARRCRENLRVLQPDIPDARRMLPRPGCGGDLDPPTAPARSYRCNRPPRAARNVRHFAQPADADSSRHDRAHSAGRGPCAQPASGDVELRDDDHRGYHHGAGGHISGHGEQKHVTAKLTTVAAFPVGYFLENIAVRADARCS